MPLSVPFWGVMLGIIWREDGTGRRGKKHIGRQSWQKIRIITLILSPPPPDTLALQGTELRLPTGLRSRVIAIAKSLWQ
jgi:hypothetical protein